MALLCLCNSKTNKIYTDFLSNHLIFFSIFGMKIVKTAAILNCEETPMLPLGYN